MAQDNILQNNDPEAGRALETKFADPGSIIKLLELEKGMAVADFGCGTGYFSLPIAEMVGEDGVVYALDILPEKLEVIESQAKMRSLTNLRARRVNLENSGGSKLEPGSVDWVVMKDVLFQNQGKGQILAEARRILKTGGKILLVEWKNGSTTIGPDSKLRVSKEDVAKLAQENGLGVMKEIAAGDFHYCLILVK